MHFSSRRVETVSPSLLLGINVDLHIPAELDAGVLLFRPTLQREQMVQGKVLLLSAVSAAAWLRCLSFKIDLLRLWCGHFAQFRDLQEEGVAVIS